MKCPTCQFENPESNKFCGGCGITGDTIYLASRLSDLARAGERLVGPDTYRQTVGYFDFETLEPTKVKGNGVTFLYNH